MCRVNDFCRFWSEGFCFGDAWAKQFEKPLIIAWGLQGTLSSFGLKTYTIGRATPTARRDSEPIAGC